MPCDSSCVLIGGYTLASQPVTLWPAAFAMAAMPPMKVPQMPRMWICIGLKAWDRAGSRFEDEIDRANEAQSGVKIVERKLLVHVKNRERHEHEQRNHFLQNLELAERHSRKTD